MTKTVTLSESITKKLDAIRLRFNCSYSEAIELYKKDVLSKDLEIERINEHFKAFERDTTIKPDIIEYLRAITIQIARGRNGTAVELLKELAEQKGKSSKITKLRSKK